MIVWTIVVLLIITILWLSQDRYNAICREELDHELHLKGQLSDKEQSKVWLRSRFPELREMIPKTLFRTKDMSTPAHLPKE